MNVLVKASTSTKALDELKPYLPKKGASLSPFLMAHDYRFNDWWWKDWAEHYAAGDFKQTPSGDLIQATLQLPPEILNATFKRIFPDRNGTFGLSVTSKGTSYAETYFVGACLLGDADLKVTIKLPEEHSKLQGCHLGSFIRRADYWLLKQRAKKSSINSLIGRLNH
mgnify:CR=1 FL=1